MKRLVIVLALMLGQCRARGEPASRADCEHILDRIVEIELNERGYRDEVLAVQRKREFRSRFAAEIAKCDGLPLPPAAMTCVETAQKSEQLAHGCLR
jgi:hypothetical protein